MDGQLRDKVASGVAWSMAEKVGTMLLQLAVSLTILRLLNPAIMGVIAIPTAFLAVAIVIADSGFSQALTARGHLRPTITNRSSPSTSGLRSCFTGCW